MNWWKCAPPLLAVLLLSGCGGDLLPYAHDIQNVQLMRVLGVDAGEGETLKVSASSGLQKTAEGEKGKALVLTDEANTISDAAVEIQTQSPYYVAWGHTTQILVGEELARSGLNQVLDYVERDIEMRMNIPLYIVKEGTAEELLNALGEEESVADRLESLGTDLRLESTEWKYTVQDVIGQLEDNGCALMTALRAEEGKISAEGYGWVADGALGGFLELAISRGVNLLTDHLKQGVMEVMLTDGTVAALRLTDARCDWTASVSEGRVTGMEATVDVKLGLSELNRPADPSQSSVRKEIETLAARQLQYECSEVLRISQENGADFLHLRKQAELKNPSAWKQIDQSWDEGFSALPVSVKVKTTLVRTYDVTVSAETGEDE